MESDLPKSEIDMNLRESIESRSGTDGTMSDFGCPSIIMCERHAQFAGAAQLACEAVGRVVHTEVGVAKVRHMIKAKGHKIRELEKTMENIENSLFVVKLAANGTRNTNPRLFRKAQDQTHELLQAESIASLEVSQAVPESDVALREMQAAVLELSNARQLAVEAKKEEEKLEQILSKSTATVRTFLFRSARRQLTS